MQGVLSGVNQAPPKGAPAFVIVFFETYNLPHPISKVGKRKGKRIACEASHISCRWPSRPKPVTSVAAVAEKRLRHSAASPLDCCMDAVAPVVHFATL